MSTATTGPPLDVVVLAAGRGSRLADVGADVPKWLLRVGDQTIADRQLAALDMFERNHPGRLRSVTVVTGHAADAVAALDLGPGRGRLHNPLYLTYNNWYTVLLALRALPDNESRVVVVNGDLCAPPTWICEFLDAAARTDTEALIAVDLARRLTEESMKVSRRTGASGDELDLIGKHEFPDPVGEYVGMLMASGTVLRAFRQQLAAFEADELDAQQWYEGAVGITAAKGAQWHLWATPSSRWVEIDDLDDLALAQELADA